jgi:hypothetical protein
MKVERIGRDGAAEWDAYVDAHPDSTVYHRYAWREIFGRSFGYRSAYLVVRKDGAIAGCVPLFLVTSPFAARRLAAVPFRDRGGLLWTDDAAFMALTREAEALAAEWRATSFELKSVTRYPASLVEECGLREHLYWVRSVVDLTTLDREQLWKELGAKTRNMLRQGEQASLELRDLTDTQDAGVSIWYDLYLQTQQRMGLPPFPLRFFATMMAELREPRAARLYAVFHEGQALAATIVLLHGRVGIYGYSASSRAGQAYRPNDFMLYQVMCRLLDERYAAFDLGSDAPSQDSLLFFKRKWLAAQSPVPVYVAGKADFSVSDSSHPRYRLAREVFRRMPRPLLRAVGGVTTRFFG